MDETPKDFDAVAMMREARDRISRDIRDMSFDEQKIYFRKHAELARQRLNSVERTGAV